MRILRQWETSNYIIEIYRIIAKNRKIIKDKAKLFTIEPNSMLIKASDLIYVLKSILTKIKDKEVILNYEVLIKPYYTVRENDIFSVRKYGKYKFVKVVNYTKKNNYIIEYLKYIQKLLNI